MNKIPIEQLLNPVHQEFSHEKLKNINNKLLNLCSKLPAENEQFDEEKAELERILPSLNKLIREDGSSKEDQKMVHKMYQLSSILSVLLNEVSELRAKRRQFLRSKPMHHISYEAALGNKTKEKMVFNIVTQDTLHSVKRSNKTYRGHRLPKCVTYSLESWFNKNIKHPYLNKSSMKELMMETKLSGPQIKNWVSNRRRKEKSLTVSFEVSELVNGSKQGPEGSGT
ncbi:alpha2 transcriptional factor [Zygosaccharomyces rouxii]|uniref:Alpha2 copy 2 transcriptional factor n=4 Tax=Zygosaccharomyces TaxID=4953 RepID=A0A140DD79_ZYGRO|nr:alpha2 copy 2 transcriptional factor [Zygosaccharomyces rouxii]CDM87335.1 hypothetical protein [Zygosaccharomyces sapae]BBB04552.1 mating type alpha2 [Zygosaccharomyces sp. NBRC 1876]BDH85265.1 transcription factor [Zygosaccharomyces sp.]AMK38010.1 alpha2 copy 2 transcriptional factor [Zygosaccharomyces rouxii]